MDDILHHPRKCECLTSEHESDKESLPHEDAPEERVVTNAYGNVLQDDNKVQLIKVGNSTKFIHFLLDALLKALRETHPTDQDSDQDSDQVKSLLKLLNSGALSAVDCMKKLDLSHRPTFRKNYLNPALEAGLIERTIPEKPNSKLQQYRLIKTIR